MEQVRPARTFLGGKPETTRRSFSFMAATAVSSVHGAGQNPLKILAVVAHPDDEYAFAATVYRVARELGGIVDEVVISNGEGGYRYAALAEQIYGLPLTKEETGREQLPEIRRRETLAAGRILGIRHHYFLDQKDPGYTLDPQEVHPVWNNEHIRSFLTRMLEEERYQFVFTLLPTADSHGHHQAATMLALQAVARLSEEQRPAVLGAEAADSQKSRRHFVGLEDAPLTQVGSDVHDFHRSRQFGFGNALSYQMIVNWVIAEHKSQGLFQTEVGRYDTERFWRFELSGAGSEDDTSRLFQSLSTEAVLETTLQAARAR